MKQIIRIAIPVMAAVLLWNCSKNNDRIATKTDLVVTAYTENPDDTKTTLIECGTGVYWEPGDKIKVFYKDGTGRFTSTNTETSKVASFSGSINIVIGSDEGFVGDEKMWGVYPYRADASYDGTSVTTVIPDRQTGRAGSFAKGMNISVAKSSNLALAFYNVCGGVRFSVKRSDITDVFFEGGNNESLAGTAKISFSGGVPVIQSLTDGKQKITLTAPGGGTFEAGKWYYIIAAPGALTNGFKLTFNTATKYAELVKTNSVTVKRGIFGSLENADEGLTFKDKKTPTGNIVFKDQTAKFACVSKFDTNQDGELSYEEAAAVTDITGLFTSWKTVKSFDELKHFTSLANIGQAMMSLASLKSVTLPPLVTSIPDYAFSGCAVLDSLTVMSGRLTSVGGYAFHQCKALASFDFFSELTFIGLSAFENCTSLASVDFPASLEAIDLYAFKGCTSLASVDFPASLESIGDGAFSRCTSLASVDFPASLEAIGSNAFNGCISLTSVTVPNSVTSLGDAVFEGCTSLVSAALPAELKGIPYNMFYDCRRLTDFTFPENITSIGEGAFHYCYLLKGGASRVDIPSTITSIGNYNFERVRNVFVTSVSIPTIGTGTFGGHTKIFVPAGKVEMYKAAANWSAHADCIFATESYTGDTAPAGTVDMGTSVFWATCNLGAANPEGYGDYYAWGETEPYYAEGQAQSENPTWKEGKSAGYDWMSYRWCNGSSRTLTKYCTDATYGTVDNKTVLEKSDDAASAALGENFCMPTTDEWRQLYDFCTWTWISRGGHNGYEVTSSVTGNTIFLPASGCRYDTYLGSVGSGGYYWSSSLTPGFPGNPDRAYSCYFYSGSVHPQHPDDYRYCGKAVRPVSY